MACPGIVRLRVHEPLAAPLQPAGVVQQARELADRVRAIVVSGVERQEPDPS
jgi:hypothetical protein